MPHISLPEGIPGISSGFAFRPETAKPMRELAHILLHGPNTLTPAERELIATYVSSRNDCYFCQTSHGAAAAAHLGKDAGLVEQIKQAPWRREDGDDFLRFSIFKVTLDVICFLRLVIVFILFFGVVIILFRFL